MDFSSPAGLSATTPWVFVHGFLGTGQDWDAVQSALRARGWQAPAWAPDLPGHGRTPLGVARPSYAAWIAWLDAYLDARGVRGPVVLVGYSLGGRLALAWGARHPTRVAGLALLAAHPGLTDPQARAARAAQDDARASMLRTQGLAAFLDAWYRLPLFALAERPRLRAAVVARRRRQDAAALATVIAALSPGRQPPLWDALARLAPRTLYLAGGRDAKYRALAADLASRFPRLRVAIIPQAGHLLPLDAPEAVAAALYAWAHPRSS